MMRGDDAEMMALNLRYAESELRALKASQLDAFATAALSGLCAYAGSDSPHVLAERAYKVAEAMTMEKRSRAGLAC